MVIWDTLICMRINRLDAHANNALVWDGKLVLAYVAALVSDNFSHLSLLRCFSSHVVVRAWSRFDPHHREKISQDYRGCNIYQNAAGNMFESSG